MEGVGEAAVLRRLLLIYRLSRFKNDILQIAFPTVFLLVS
jgi:hypothetical protein